MSNVSYTASSPLAALAPATGIAAAIATAPVAAAPALVVCWLLHPCRPCIGVAAANPDTTRPSVVRVAAATAAVSIGAVEVENELPATIVVRLTWPRTREHSVGSGTAARPPASLLVGIPPCAVGGAARHCSAGPTPSRSHRH